MSPDPDPQQAVLAYVTEEVGDHLRAVDYFDRDTHENLYIRDDVSALYTDREFEQMRFERVSNLLNVGFFEELYSVGEFRYSIRRFDRAVLLYLPLGEANGMVVSIDVDAAIPVGTVGDHCADLVAGAA